MKVMYEINSLIGALWPETLSKEFEVKVQPRKLPSSMAHMRKLSFPFTNLEGKDESLHK